MVPTQAASGASHNSTLVLMRAERAIAILAALAGAGLIFALPDAASGYWRAANAAEWDTTVGRVTERTNVTLPSFMCFARSARYSLIEYRYEGPDGAAHVATAQAPLQSDIYPGGTIEVRFDRTSPTESLPAVSVSGYRAAHGGTLLVGLPLGLLFLYAARRLWRPAGLRHAR